MYRNGMCRYHGGVLSQYVCAHRLHHTSPILPYIYTCCICTFYIVMEYSETIFFSTVDIKCSEPVVW